MTNAEFLLANGFIETTEEIFSKYPSFKKNHPNQRWFKIKEGKDNPTYTDFYIEDDWTLEYCLYVIHASSFNDGSRWRAKEIQKNVSERFKRIFNKFQKEIDNIV